MFQHKTKLAISIDTNSNIYDYTPTLKFRDIGLQFSKYGLPLLLDSTDIIGIFSIMTIFGSDRSPRSQDVRA